MSRVFQQNWHAAATQIFEDQTLKSETLIFPSPAMYQVNCCLARERGSRRQLSWRSTIHEVCRFSDGTGLEMTGTYYDDLFKDEKGWRFKKRTYRCIYFNPQPPAGQVIRIFPEQA